MNDSQTHFLKLLQEKPKYSKLKYHLCNSSQNSAIQDQFLYELKFLEFCQPSWMFKKPCHDWLEIRKLTNRIALFIESHVVFCHRVRLRARKWSLWEEGELFIDFMAKAIRICGNGSTFGYYLRF